MTIVLTGGTGYIGSAVLRELVRHGHEVTALVRSEAAAATVQKNGAVAEIGDLTDGAWLSSHLAGADGAIHTAARGDGTDETFDRAVVTAVRSAFAGSGKPYVHTGGAWVFGDGADLTEESPLNPPALTAWRVDVEKLVLPGGDAPVGDGPTAGLPGGGSVSDGLPGGGSATAGRAGDLVAAVVAPGIVFGHGAGIPRLIADGPRDAEGRLLLIGDGSQHWTTIHVEDVARLYVTVFTALRVGQRPGTVVGVSGLSPTVRELGETYAQAAGLPGVAPEGADASRARLGAAFADALLLDQQASGAKARSLGWTPTGPSLVEEFAQGYPPES